MLTFAVWLPPSYMDCYLKELYDKYQEITKPPPDRTEPTFESRFNLNLLQLLLYGFARSIARLMLCMFSPKDGLSVL